MKKVLLVLLSLAAISLNSCTDAGHSASSLNETTAAVTDSETTAADTTDTYTAAVVTSDTTTQNIVPSDLFDPERTWSQLYVYGNQYYICKLSDTYVPIELEHKDYIGAWNEYYDNHEYMCIFDRELNAYMVMLDEPYEVTPFEISDSLLTKFGDYTILAPDDYTAMLLDKNMDSVLAAANKFTIFGNLLIKKDGVDPGSYQLYDSNLELINDGFLYYSMLWSLDSGMLIVPYGTSYRIYLPSGEVKFESREYDEILYIIENMILVVDGGQVKLIDIDGKERAVLCEWNDKMSFHWMLSGYYSKEGYPTGYYFVFEDRTKAAEESGIEYCYEPWDSEVTSYIIGEILGYAKPVLYLYPTELTDVTVTFERPELLTTVYPAYNSGWHVHADVDGTLTDGQRSYYALYWEEAALTERFIYSDGFCVTADNAIDFLEEKLDAIGLTEREANEFIMYWLPILEKNGISLVHFELTESRETTNALHISPAPDSLLRVAIHILPIDEITSIPEQKLPHFDRHGFAAVEWGGRNYS